MKAKPSSLIFIEYWFAKGAFALLRAVPRSVGMYIATAVIRFLYFFARNNRKWSLIDIKQAFPDLDHDAHLRILNGSIQNLGRVIYELSQLPDLDRQRVENLVEVDAEAVGYKQYRELKSQGRGVIWASAHIGNWELLLVSSAILDEPGQFLSFTIDNPRLHEWIKGERERFGNVQLDIKGSAKEVIRQLKSGGNVGYLADVNVPRSQGIFVPFFGMPACTTSSVALFSLRADAMIVPAFLIWSKERGRYQLNFGEPIEPVRCFDLERNIYETTKLYTGEIEKMVRQYPDQWLWILRRWKTRPPGEDDLHL